MAKVIWHYAVLLQTCYFGGTGSRLGSAMVPLDRALMSIVTLPLSVMLWLKFSMCILTVGSDPLPVPGALSNTTKCYLGPHECPCQMASPSFQQL